ncbi:hypothetical protein [Brevundimonas sp. UBA7664]|uniref:hypothetical protein n=1 Tax=Brevundimonas sp. UBA7664 TaxID=1946141 RepID=UPI0025BE6AC1|nr:hypothetical protein [Brevundimonas sp. UBA7664]
MKRTYLYRIAPGTTAQAIDNPSVGPQPVDLLRHLEDLADIHDLRAVIVNRRLAVTIPDDTMEVVWLVATKGLATPFLIYSPAA